ncbi:MAG: hypothetical protein SVU94_11435 [Bacteroidota bacterium]|nr:hypothetical protein [Bacteroidota bacterium]
MFRREYLGFLEWVVTRNHRPFDLIDMLFRDDVSVYAHNNNGAWYAFGFLIGSGGWGIFSGKGAASSKRKRAH